MIGLATVQPGQSIDALVFCGLAGIGFAGPLTLIVAGVQLATPHHLISTATAVITSTRAVAATVFTAIYTSVVTARAKNYTRRYVGTAVEEAGLPRSGVGPFIAALTSRNSTALANVSGANENVIRAGEAALQHAQADSMRAVWIIAAAFGGLACVVCWFMGDIKKTMTYRVDAPVEELHAKGRCRAE
ncbi:uncharacterized protein MYCFIDRAFT_201173 [Pseudocercospora fijiensis CIRAD86]|uniref:Major facilitator superfamily (MFS) profile domain-containing protein n=1 Tax=Pseudocercospora fijiensis (strain CIRAD86) TaxID=383855 RepID=N1Q9J7_PSEFD|nr:uncharacterized protein MYCFIDRAFT_201173 [Pseudocercospora fijiensis CIRAD86]EME87562.1 hypothetical protein MYCFIDRAFT_201173 [Pseudocercospora fijiensis CIRAD86]